MHFYIQPDPLVVFWIHSNSSDQRAPVFQCNSASCDPQHWHYEAHSSSHGFAGVSQRPSVFVTLSLESSCLPPSEIHISLCSFTSWAINSQFTRWKKFQISHAGATESFCDVCRELIHLLAAAVVSCRCCTACRDMKSICKNQKILESCSSINSDATFETRSACIELGHKVLVKDAGFLPETRLILIATNF